MVIIVAVAAFCVKFIPVFLPQAEAQVSPEMEQAFLAAGIKIQKRQVDPKNFTLPLLSGGTASLSAYKGKVVFLNFWATWCPPCQEEMPSMEKLYQRLKSQGLEILAVDLGEDSGTVQQFIRDRSYTFPVLLDMDNKVGSLYGIRSIPSTFIIDREGKIISMIVGGRDWDDPKLMAAFEVLLSR